MNSIAEIVEAVSSPFSLWRTLKGVEVERSNGLPIYFTGNASVLFPVKINRQRKMLKCYTRHNPHLKAIYKEGLYIAELAVHNIIGQRHWMDCLVMDYVEGITLHQALCLKPEQKTLQRLAEAFDEFATDLLGKEYAHGDLKPENIIWLEDGKFSAIDWDAAFIPSLKGNQALETGTAAYQHPLRNTELYNKHIDDYSIAFISTMLNAYATLPTLAEHYHLNGEFQLHPRQLTQAQTNYNFIHQLHSDNNAKPGLLDEILDLFAQKAMARQYRIAKTLRSTSPEIFSLQRLFCEESAEIDNQPLEADAKHGLWGYRNAQGWVVKPLYDECHDEQYGILQVRLAEYIHLLSISGKLLLTLKGVEKVKITEQRVVILHNNGEEQIIPHEELGVLQ